MKTTKAIRGILRVIVVVVLSVFMYSCEGEDGAVGPQGEQGEQGPAGQNGTDGIDGTDGTDGTNGTDGTDGQDGETGTANVIYSRWIDSGFLSNITASSTSFIINAPDLTNEIRNSGVILVYGRRIRNRTIVIFGLPFVNSQGINNYFIIPPRVSGVERIQVVMNTIDGSAIGVPFLDEYRYVLIPGGVPAGRNASAVDYTKMSYKEIVTLFNIPE